MKHEPYALKTEIIFFRIENYISTRIWLLGLFTPIKNASSVNKQPETKLTTKQIYKMFQFLKLGI
jgi:hypothetical protein